MPVNNNICITVKLKTYVTLLLFTFWGISLWPLSGNAQSIAREASLSISGEVKTPLQLTSASIDTMEKVTIIAKDRNEKEHQYSGAALSVILKKAGVTMGEELRGKNLTKYLLIEARDGYQAVFSLAEADPAFSPKKIILANRIDGVALPADAEPFSVIVEGEMRKSRFVRQVVSIKVKYAN